MKPTEMPMVSLAIIWMLAFYTVPSASVPIIPGWEEEPVKYTLNVYAICDYYCAREFYPSPQKAITEVVGKASKIMSQVNVEIVLVGLDIWDKHGWTNWTSNPKPQEISSQFNWFGRQIDVYLKQVFFDELILFTGMTMIVNGESAGVLGMNQPDCISNSRCWGVVGVSPGFQHFLPATTAHEFAHAFGVQHDSDSCDCVNGPDQCVMNAAIAYSSASSPAYSSCSKEQFKAWVDSPNGLTVRKPTALSAAQVGGARCGNGFVDDGEECDCGPSDLPVGCSKCCNNCKLFQGAQCAAGMCCDTPTCKFHNATKLCRNSRDDSCDEDDFCSGKSSECENSYKPDWADCTDFANDTGYCKEGFCNTINTQCRFVWDNEYKAASDSCYNKSLNSAQQNKNSTAMLNQKCQTLICGGDGKNAGLHSGRNPQRTYLGKDECLTGRYLEVERALLGLSGTMMVEDGTKCAEDSACFAGECLPRSTVVEKMKAEPAFEMKTARCGDGKVDPGEDCDCGPEQCECCEIMTCKIRPKDFSCIGFGCGLCDGKSTDCNGPWGKASDFKLCSAENTNEICFDGDCHELSVTCAAHFWLSDAVNSAQSRNAGQASQNYNSGGFFLLDSSSSSRVYEEYSPDEADGMCGIAHCQKAQYMYPPRYFVQDGNENLVTRFGRGGAEYPVKQFSADGGSQVLYYSPKGPFTVTLPSGEKTTVSMYVPLMPDEGQACTLPGKIPGYCRKVQVKSTQIPSITYDRMNCTEIPIPPSYENLYPFN